jgi:hypothetical protein
MTLADCGVMNDSAPDLHMLNLIVGDMQASLDFYGHLGVTPGGRAHPAHRSAENAGWLQPGAGRGRLGPSVARGLAGRSGKRPRRAWLRTS